MIIKFTGCYFSPNSILNDLEDKLFWVKNILGGLRWCIEKGDTSPYYYQYGGAEVSTDKIKGFVAIVTDSDSCTVWYEFIPYEWLYNGMDQQPFQNPDLAIAKIIAIVGNGVKDEDAVALLNKIAPLTP